MPSRSESARPRCEELAIPPEFQKYLSNGLDLTLSYETSSQLCDMSRVCVFKILKHNMAAFYNAAGGLWIWSDEKKQCELFDGAAQFIIVRDLDSNEIVGFAHIRFLSESDIDVLYVYEIHLTSSVRGKGLGTFMMRLIELTAVHQGVAAVQLTCLPHNVRAMDFYRQLGYELAPDSPGNRGVADATHEELRKVVRG